MILGGGLILQSLAGGGTSGGKVNKLDMCDLFEQQTPLWSGNLFGDYSAKLVQLPEGTWWNRNRHYSTNSDIGSYCSTDAHNIACIVGTYRNDTLLYLGWPTTTNDLMDRYTTFYDAETAETIVYKSDTYSYAFDFSKLTFSGSIAATSYYGSIRIPYTNTQTTYSSDGTITGQYTNSNTWGLSAEVSCNSWYFTRFSGEELKRQMDICMQDVYAEYLRTQAT